MANKKLTAARQAIDQVDEEIHRLIGVREKHVQEVNAAKRESAPLPVAYRPFREAEMMTALRRRHHHDFSFKSTEHLWREIIAGFTQYQQPFRVHLIAPSIQVYDSARFHFGYSTQILDHQTPEDLIQASAEQASDLVYLPVGTFANHLQRLCISDSFYIFSRLPFFSDYPFEPAFVLARAIPEWRSETEHYYLASSEERRRDEERVLGINPDRGGATFMRSSMPPSEAELANRESSDDHKRMWLGCSPVQDQR